MRERGILREIRKKRKMISCLRCIQGPSQQVGPTCYIHLKQEILKCGTCGGEGVCEYVVGKIEEAKKNEGT